MLETPYRVLRWYAFQSVKLEAAEDLRQLDLAVVSILADPSSAVSELRRDLLHAAQHGYFKGAEVLTPAEFRRKVEARMQAL